MAMLVLLGVRPPAFLKPLPASLREKQRFSRFGRLRLENVPFRGIPSELRVMTRPPPKRILVLEFLYDCSR